MAAGFVVAWPSKPTARPRGGEASALTREPRPGIPRRHHDGRPGTLLTERRPRRQAPRGAGFGCDCFSERPRTALTEAGQPCRRTWPAPRRGDPARGRRASSFGAWGAALSRLPRGGPARLGVGAQRRPSRAPPRPFPQSAPTPPPSSCPKRELPRLALLLPGPFGLSPSVALTRTPLSATAAPPSPGAPLSASQGVWGCAKREG